MSRGRLPLFTKRPRRGIFPETHRLESVIGAEVLRTPALIRLRLVLSPTLITAHTHIPNSRCDRLLHVCTFSTTCCCPNTDASGHERMYLAVVAKGSRLWEGEHEGLPRVQHLRVKSSIVGSNSMRSVAVIHPHYCVSRLDGYMSWIKLEIFYSHLPHLWSS